MSFQSETSVFFDSYSLDGAAVASSEEYILI